MKYEEAPDDSKLEAALRAALQREDAPLGFAQRVEARIAREVKDKATTRSRGWNVFAMQPQFQLATAAMLALAIVLPLGLRRHHESEVARGEAAKQQVLLALRITGSQLRSIQERTQSINAGGMPEGDSQ